MSARYQRRSPRNSRDRARTVMGWAAFFLAVAVFSALICLVMFFKIELVTVSGAARYRESDLVIDSGIELGENIFSFRDSEVAERLMEKYPYLDSVKIHRLLPHTVEIEIKEAVPAFSVIATVGRYTIVSESGRVVEQGRGISTERVTRLVGTDFSRLPVGTDIVKETENLDRRKAKKDYQPGLYDEYYPEALEKWKTAQNVLKAIEETGLENVSYLDVSDDLSVTLLLDQRVLVALGTDYEMSYKLHFVMKVLETLGSTFTGTLDCTLVPDHGKVYSRERDIISLLHPVYMEGYY